MTLRSALWLACRADPKYFEDMCLDLKARLSGEIVYEIVDRAGSEGHGRTATFADKMMAMPRRTPDIGWRAVWLNNSCKHVDSGEDFERPIDGGPADSWTAQALAQFCNQLLS